MKCQLRSLIRHMYVKQKSFYIYNIYLVYHLLLRWSCILLFKTTGVHVFKILYEGNKIGNPLIFCFYNIFKRAMKLIKPNVLRTHGLIQQQGLTLRNLIVTPSFTNRAKEIIHMFSSISGFPISEFPFLLVLDFRLEIFF